MYIFKHACKNILRNKGRNFLIAAILFAILSTTVVTLMIHETATLLIDEYTTLFSSQVVISPDIEQLRQEATGENGEVGKVTRPTIEPELLLSFTDSPYLKESIVDASIRATSEQITAIDEDSTAMTAQPMRGGAAMGNYNLLGANYTAFTEGNRYLLDDGISVYPSEKNEAIISTDLATANNLEVGDQISFSSVISRVIPDEIDLSGASTGDTVTIDNYTYVLATDERTQSFLAQRTVVSEFTIVGLYEDISDEYADDNMPQVAAMNNRNEVITTLDTLLALRADGETGVTINAEYYLQNPADLSAFEAEVREKGLPTTFSVTTDTTTYDQLVTPLAGIRNIAIVFLAIVLILGAIIIMLLTSISIRERKYEIGVLRAMGMSKRNVVTSVWLEIVLITIACTMLGIASGAMIAKPVGNALLTAQTQNQTTNQQIPGQMGRPSSGMVMGGKQQTTQKQEIDPNLTATTMVQLFVIALLLSSVAGIIGVRQITRYEPMKILAERN